MRQKIAKGKPIIKCAKCGLTTTNQWKLWMHINHKDKNLTLVAEE